MEYEVILVQQQNPIFHILQYPLTNLQEIEKHYTLNTIKYGPISQIMEINYKRNEEESQQLPPNTEFTSLPVHNRTYFGVCQLVGKRIYFYPVQSFQRCKPKISQSCPVVIGQRDKTDELVYQRNKAKALEQQKQQWHWQQQIKESETKLNLDVEHKSLEAPDVKELDLINLKVLPRASYLNYQKMFFEQQQTQQFI